MSAFDGLDAWHFGGKGSGIEDALAALVVAGTKTATCSWFETYAVEDEPLPVVGARSVILDSQDRRVCVVEVTSVEVMRFDAVGEAFALAEGEGPYDAWRAGHERFFTEYGQRVGLEWNSATQHVVCERFRVLHVF